MTVETVFFYGAVIAIAFAWFGAFSRYQQTVIHLLLLAALLSAISIALRWISHGQGPFLTLYEVLISNVFSIALVMFLIVRFDQGMRPALPGGVLLLLVISLWALKADGTVAPLPPTFNNNWLWLHVLTGKMFLGTIWVLAGLNLYAVFNLKSDSTALVIARGFSYLNWAFLFHGAMILAGMAWAAEAWGRYWGWDGVEVWSLIIWLLLASLIHARHVYAIKPWLISTAILVIFILAFLTFFGVPILSFAPHKGVY